jgi:drug/metabolite transporter (DMT)-like permease
MARARDDMSLPELFEELARETSTLIRQEMQLVVAEVRQSTEAIGRSIAFLVAGGAVAYAGLLVLLAAVVIGLGQLGVTWWLAALIVGVVVAVVGYILVTRAQAELQTAMRALDQIGKTLQEDEAWLKKQMQ